MISRRTVEVYLKTVLLLRQRFGIVRNVDIARELGIAKASVTGSLRRLKQEGFVQIDATAPFALHLTEKGQMTAVQACERQGFLRDWLVWSGVDQEKAESDAWELAYVFCPESFELVRKAMARRIRTETDGA